MKNKNLHILHHLMLLFLIGVLVASGCSKKSNISNIPNAALVGTWKLVGFIDPKTKDTALNNPYPDCDSCFTLSIGVLPEWNYYGYSSPVEYGTYAANVQFENNRIVMNSYGIEVPVVIINEDPYEESFLGGIKHPDTWVVDNNTLLKLTCTNTKDTLLFTKKN